MKEKTKVGLFVGLTTVDVFNYVDSFPGENEKKRAHNQLACAGGPAANAAISYSLMGSSARLISYLGANRVADIAHWDIRKHNVLLFDLAKDQNICPTLSTVIVNKENGNRCVVYGSASYASQGSVIDLDIVMQDAKILLFDGHYIDDAIPIAKLAKENSIPVVVDCGSWKERLDALLPYVDIAICSANFTVPGLHKSCEIISYFQQYGIAKIAITRGDKPILVMENENFYTIDIPKVKAVDTLGAGDIFHGCFCHYYPQLDFKKSLEHASVLASSSVTQYGTRSWHAGFVNDSSF